MRIEIVSEKITDLLEKQGAIESDKSEFYVYGMTLMISSTVTLLATLLLGFVFHVINSVLVFLLFFVSVRIFSGGYHSSSYLRCFLTFMLMQGSFIVIQRNLPERAVLPSTLIISLISLFLIFKFSPVSHPNAPKRASDWFRFKRLSRIICIIETSCIFLLLTRSQRFFGQSAKQHFVDVVVARRLGTSEGFGSPVVSVPDVGCRRPQYIRRWLGGRIHGSDRISSVRFLS